MSTTTLRKSSFFRYIVFTVLAAFVGMFPVQPSYAQVAIIMPPVGQMVHVTRHFEPPQMVGLKINLKDPFSFGFIMDQGENPMSDAVKKEEFNKIIKYFLVSLAMPNKDMWVNLSPYESKRIIPEVFGQTEMGRDLLAQDYILKQFTASLMYPEDGLGKEFWTKIYAQAQARFGTTDINVNTFNKVWIVADHADVYQKDDTAFLVGSHLKVMLEQDFKAIEQNKEQFGEVNAADNDSTDAKTQMASQIVREIIIPAIEKEVNEGQSFAAVRQIYNAEIMATWFKKTLRASLLGQVFANKSKIAGQRVSDPQAKEKIFQQYLLAYKQGVFNIIKQEPTSDGQMIPRRYLSGGMEQVLPGEVNGFTDADKIASLQQENEEVKALLEKLKEQRAEMVENFTMPSDSTITPMDLAYRIARMPVSKDARNVMMAALVSHITEPNVADDNARAGKIRALAADFKAQNIAGLKDVEALKNFVEKQLAKSSSTSQPNEPLVEPTVRNLLTTLNSSSLPEGVTPDQQNMMLATVMHELTKPAPQEDEEVANTEAKLETGARDKRLSLAMTDFVLNKPEPQAAVPAAEPVERLFAGAINDAIMGNPNRPQRDNMIAEILTPLLANQTSTSASDIGTRYQEQLAKNPDAARDLVEQQLTERSNQQMKDFGSSIRDIQGNLRDSVSQQIGSNPYLKEYAPIAQSPVEIRQSAIEKETRPEVAQGLRQIEGARAALERNVITELNRAIPDNFKNAIGNMVGTLANRMVGNAVSADAALLSIPQRELTEPGVTPSLSSSLEDIKNALTTTPATATVSPEHWKLYNDLLANQPKLPELVQQGGNESAIEDMLAKMAIQKQDMNDAIEAMKSIAEAHLAAVSAAKQQLGLSAPSAQELTNKLIGQTAEAASGNAANSLALDSIEDLVRTKLQTVQPSVLESYTSLQKEQPDLVARAVLQGGNESNTALSDMVGKIMSMKENQELTKANVQEGLNQIRAVHLAAAQSAAGQGLSAPLAQELAQQMVSRASENNLGGINLSDEHLTMNIKVDGAGMPLASQYQDKAMLNLNGLVSIIRSITPITQQNVPALYELAK